MMGSCVGTRRKGGVHRESIWSSASTVKEPYFTSSYALLLNYKNDEEVLTTMKALRTTIESGVVDAECFVDNFTTECLIDLMNNESFEVQKSALLTLKVIIVEESKCHFRDTPLSPLLIDCGYFYKIKKLLSEHSDDTEIIEASIESLNGIVYQQSISTMQIIIEQNLIGISANFLKDETLGVETLKTILQFLLTIIRHGNSAQIEYFCEDEIAGPLAERACSGDENAELALKCLNLLLKKNVVKR